LVYGGDGGIVIPAGIKHDVICLEYKGNPTSPPNKVEIEYELSAEGIEPARGTLTVALGP
jgi:hypothetical protein